MKIDSKMPIDLNKWCIYLVNVAHITTILIILAHIIWFVAARSILAWPPEVYLRNYIILPALGFSTLNILVAFLVRSTRISILVKEFVALSLFILFSLYLSLTHDIARVLLCSYMLPIFISALFSNKKLTRRIFYMSVVAILFTGVKKYFMGALDSDMLMEIFVAIFMFLCSYLLAKIIMQYGQDNLTALMKSKEEAMNHELAFLQAQIKPHFLYNVINTMVSLCYTDNEKAARLLVNFSKYLRLIFDFDHKLIWVPLAREIEMIKVYIEIEKARFGESIDVEYDIDSALLTMEIPSFCIQPLVENAIKHGVRKKDALGKVLISVQNEDGIKIKVSDNGIGMSLEKLKNLKLNENISEGVGFYNVCRRVKVWENTRIDIQSMEGKGTTVTVIISDGIK